MKRPCLLDSSFLIGLLNEVADGVPGPAMAWLRKHRQTQLWISPVTYAEVLEGAENVVAVREHLQRYRWQGLHQQQAERVTVLQRRSAHRMGENDAWQAATALAMKGVVLGHDPKAFSRLGAAYIDHRKS
ncbi:MAG: type II toxin-antitoxin system VapC family toxin [Verrucomicrobiota bacterium]